MNLNKVSKLIMLFFCTYFQQVKNVEILQVTSYARPLRTMQKYFVNFNKTSGTSSSFSWWILMFPSISDQPEDTVPSYCHLVQLVCKIKDWTKILKSKYIKMLWNYTSSFSGHQTILKTQGYFKMHKNFRKSITGDFTFIPQKHWTKISKTVQLLQPNSVFFYINNKLYQPYTPHRPHVVLSFQLQCTQYGCVFTVTFNLWMVQKSSSGHSWRKCWKFGRIMFVKYVFTHYID